jgi:hypothetical protein
MVGRSGPGFFQLRTAATRPPSLGAITPASVLGGSFGLGGRPGGIVNLWVDTQLSGWSIDRKDGLPDHAHPPRYAPGGRDAWVTERCAGGQDPVAVQNQLLRGQTLAPLDEPRPEHDTPERAELTSPVSWASAVRCPTLLMGSWQDEESGPGWDDLLAAFPDDTEVCLLGTNGTHDESRFPELIGRWASYLSERLRGEPLGPTEHAEAYLRAATRDQLGPHDLRVGPARSLPPGRAAVIRLENGAGPGGHGLPTTRGEVTLDGWPPADTRTWDLGADGCCRYRYDPSVRPPTSGGRPGFDADAPDPDYDWRPLPDGFGLAFATAPLAEDVLLCGPASVDLWLGCTAPDVDLEVTLAELRPDGWETYVQAGWLRASFRRLDEVRSTPARPVPTYAAADVADLPAGEPALVRVPVPSVAHPLRAGSRLVLRIEPPGGVQPSWSFAARWPDGRHEGRPVHVEIGTGPATPSRLVVSVAPVPDLAELPPPGALRRQPSRPSAQHVLDGGGDEAGAAVDGVLLEHVGAERLAAPSP